MKVVIFAGGAGTRLWPISRKKFPKQFQPIINNKSSLQLRMEQLTPLYGWNNVYFSTGESLVSLIKNIFPQVPTTNIITEPTRRDVGPAVGLSMIKLQKLGAGDEPVAVLWGDSVTQNYDNLKKVLEVGENLVKENPNRIVWLGEKPSFANSNVGWIALGDEISNEQGISYYQLEGFKYRPELELAKKWYEDGKHLINTGYFITTPNFILSKYEANKPELYEQLQKIGKAIGTDHETDVLNEVYPQMEAIHFDNVVLDYLKAEEVTIMECALQWDDPGTLYALKQFLQENEEDNVCKGLVYTHDTKDSLVYNYVNKQLVATVGLEGFVVVNTPDAVLVVPKDKIGEIKEMLKQFSGSELEKLL
jgi:mannose-1-phosphate guanylyltransferase